MLGAVLSRAEGEAGDVGAVRGEGDKGGFWYCSTIGIADRREGKKSRDWIAGEITIPFP